MASLVGHGTTFTGTLARTVSPFTLANTSTVPDVAIKFVHCWDDGPQFPHALPWLASFEELLGTANCDDVRAALFDRAENFESEGPLDAIRFIALLEVSNDQPRTVTGRLAVTVKVTSSPGAATVVLDAVNVSVGRDTVTCFDAESPPLVAV